MERRLCWFVAWFLLTVPGDATDDWLPSEDLFLPVATTTKPGNSTGSGIEEVTIPIVDEISNSSSTLNATELMDIVVTEYQQTTHNTKPEQMTTTMATKRGGTTSSKKKKLNRNRQGPSISKSESSNITTEPGVGHLNDNPWFYGSNDALYGRGTRRRNHSKESKHKNPVVRPPVTIRDTSPPWKESTEEWGVFWPAHYYATGSLFAALSLYSVISLLRVRTFSSLLGVGHFVVLHLLLLILGITRSFYLLFDPYNSDSKLHPILACILTHMGDPCLISSFTVIFSALLNETLVPFILSGPLRRPIGLAVLIVFHFAVAADIIAGSVLRSDFVVLVGHLLTSIWLVLLTAVFVTAFPRLRRTALRKQGDMIRVAFTKLHIDGAQLPRKLPRPTLALSVKVALISTFFCLILAGLKLYNIVNFFLTFRLPKPWTWWGVQLASRLTELFLALAMTFIAAQPMDGRFFDDDTRGEHHADSTLPLPDTLPLRSLLQQHPTGSTMTSDSRPSSMLFKDNGFIRFRTEDDPEQPIDCSDDEDDEEGDSVRANAGSSCDAADVIMSPFFERGKQFSRGSLDTSASSEQLSRNGLSNSAIDFQLRKYGSTCSSESAANSFDVTFFLQHHHRSISPMAAARGIVATPRRRLPGVLLNLDLRNDDRVVGCGVVNVACGTEDITPDSAVYMDLHLAKRAAPLHSHSLGDLVSTSRSRRTLLRRLKGSTFSLNASLNGYEPLDGVEDDEVYENKRRRRTGRWGNPSLLDVRDFVKGVALPQVDSGLLGDCAEPVLQVDQASQTDEVQAGIMSVCGEIGRWNCSKVEQVV